MTLDEAVAVLNANRHRDRADWQIFWGKTVGTPFEPLLEEFEAIAVAERYERQRIARPPGSVGPID